MTPNEVRLAGRGHKLTVSKDGLGAAHSANATSALTTMKHVVALALCFSCVTAAYADSSSAPRTLAAFLSKVHRV